MVRKLVSALPCNHSETIVKWVVCLLILIFWNSQEVQWSRLYLPMQRMCSSPGREDRIPHASGPKKKHKAEAIL